MRDSYLKVILTYICITLTGMGILSNSYAQEFSQPVISDNDAAQVLNLVQNNEPQRQSTPPSGTLLFPDSSDRDDREGKKCMTVCARWGEECTYVDRGPAGTTRDCRRTCQQFTEECF